MRQKNVGKGKRGNHNSPNRHIPIFVIDRFYMYYVEYITYSSSLETYFKITVNFGCSMFDEASKTGNFTRKNIKNKIRS